MSGEFSIDCEQSTSRLTISDEPPRGLNDWDEYACSVSLGGGDVQAKLVVRDVRSHHWTNFFESLANEPSGWVDARTCESLEENLGLSATCSRTGHVIIRATLVGGAPDDSWQVAVNLHSSLGRLQCLAKEAELFFGPAG